MCADLLLLCSLTTRKLFPACFNVLQDGCDEDLWIAFQNRKTVPEVHELIVSIIEAIVLQEAFRLSFAEFLHLNSV